LPTDRRRPPNKGGKKEGEFPALMEEGKKKGKGPVGVHGSYAKGRARARKGGGKYVSFSKGGN